MPQTTQTIRTLIRTLAQSTERFVQPPLGRLYERAAQQEASSRNPLIVIPGIMGSRLVNRTTGATLWGAPRRADYADPCQPAQIRAICRDMGRGAPLDRLEDNLAPDGAIDRMRLSLAGLPVYVRAYGAILELLGVGGYLVGPSRSRHTPTYGPSAISTCFQFDYDWRLSIAHNAARLEAFIDSVLEFYCYDTRGCDPGDARVDIVAHSMGGLLMRYFLRYGGRPIEGARPPEVNWRGLSRVEHAITVGPPNGGSVMALRRLLRGLPKSPATPAYHQAFLGTFPSIYQLLPRTRHHAVLDPETGEPVDDLFDAELWARHAWGLGDPDADDALRLLLPDAGSHERREIALDHLAKCLEEARLVHEALDLPVDAPEGAEMHLFAGDGVRTPAVVRPGRSAAPFGEIDWSYGDGTVVRGSAIMDERMGQAWSPRVKTPIDWNAVTFVATDHMGLTKHPTFINNVLYILLEKPRPDCGFRAPAPEPRRRPVRAAEPGRAGTGP